MPRFPILLSSLAMLSTMSLFAQDPLPPARVTPQPASECEKLFSKISFDQLPGNLNAYIRDEWFLLTGGTPESYNSMTAGWGGTGILWGKQVAFVFVHTDRFTYKFMEQSDMFTMSFMDRDARPALANIFGRKSGRDTDKVTEAGVTPIATPEGGVTYQQARLVIVCKRIAKVPLTQDLITGDIGFKYGENSYHCQYVGQIIGIWKHNP